MLTHHALALHRRSTGLTNSRCVKLIKSLYAATAAATVLLI